MKRLRLYAMQFAGEVSIVAASHSTSARAFFKQYHSLPDAAPAAEFVGLAKQGQKPGVIFVNAKFTALFS